MSVQETQARFDTLAVLLKDFATYNQIVELLATEMQYGKLGDVKMHLDRLNLSGKPLSGHGFELIIDYIKNRKSN